VDMFYTFNIFKGCISNLWVLYYVISKDRFWLNEHGCKS
jgi:hypothetical protein